MVREVKEKTKRAEDQESQSKKILQEELDQNAAETSRRAKMKKWPLVTLARDVSAEL